METAYHKDGFEITLTMLASAMDPRFKYLSFVDAETRTQVYQKVKASIITWTLDRQQALSAAANASIADLPPSTSSTLPLHTTGSTSQPAARRTAFDMFSCLTQTDTAANNTCDYDKVKADVGMQFCNFLCEPGIGAHDDPLEWWKMKKSQYPALEIGVRRLFCIPATSAPVERVFSSAENIVNKKRLSLLPQNVDMLVFMHNNKHLIR